LKPIEGSVRRCAREQSIIGGSRRGAVGIACISLMVLALCGCALQFKNPANSCTDNATCTQGIQLLNLFGKDPRLVTLADLPAIVTAMSQPCTLLLDYKAITVAPSQTVSNPPRIVTWRITPLDPADSKLRIDVVFDEKNGVAFTKADQTDFVSPSRVSDTVFTWNAVTPGSNQTLGYGLNLDIKVSGTGLPISRSFSCKLDPTIVNSL